MKKTSLFFILQLALVGFVHSSEPSNSNIIFGSSTDYPTNSNILVGKDLGNIFQKSTTEGLLNTPLNCKECKEIVDLFHDSYVNGISINSIDFFPMKALVQNCYQNNYKECGGKMEKQLDLLLGNLEGGPLTQGETSNWRMPVRTDLSRITTNKFDAISNFRKSYDESLIKDCSECTEIVDRFYTTYTNNINLNEAEFANLKNKVQTCFFQKVSGCGSQMEKQLNILTGNLAGGPPTSSKDPKSKWRIKSSKKGPFTPEFQELTPIPNGDVIFRYNNLYGVKDKNNLVFIYPQYEKIKHINFKNSDYLIVTKDKKEGVIDLFGNVKLPIEYFSIRSNPLNPNLLVFESFDKKNGVIFGDFFMREIESDGIIFFEEKFTTFQKDGKYGFLDNNGDIKIEPKYDKVNFIGEGYDFRYFTLEDVMLFSGGGSVEVRYIPSNNVLVVEKDNKFGLIGDNLNEVLPPKYDKIGHINIDTSTCVKGLIPIWENGKMGYVNELGEILISPKYDMINGFGIKNWLKDEVSYVSIDKKWGLFSNKNRVELTPIQYDNISYDKESLFKVEIQNKTGLLNFSGKEILSPDNYEITGFEKKQSFLILKKEGKYGLFNKDGSLFTSCIYDEIDPHFNSNLNSRIKKDFKWGVIDRNGNQIVEARFDNLIPIANNFYQVSSGNKWGLIDKSGTLVISTKYDEPFTFSNGKATVKLNGLAFRINEREEVVYNDFQNSTLSQLEVGGENMKKQIESRFRIAILGSKTPSKETITNLTNEIKLTVEGWLSGQMTNAQLNEFNEIIKQEAATANKNTQSSGSAQVRVSVGSLCDNGNAYRNQTVVFSAFYSDGEQVGDKWPLRSQGLNYERINSSFQYSITSGNETFYSRIIRADCMLFLRIPYDLDVPNARMGQFIFTGKVTDVGNSYVMLEVSSIRRIQ